MANEYIIRTDMKVSGSALTVDALTTLQNTDIQGTLTLNGGGNIPTLAPSQTPDTPIVSPGGNDFVYLSEPDQWISVNIDGNTHVIPAYAV